jgi:NitT/TauT family transport system substrate-binding protein
MVETFSARPDDELALRLLAALEAQLEAQGVRIVYMKYADFGVNTMGHGIVTSNRILAENPGLVKRFLSATAKGWADALKDPEAAMDALFKSFPQLRDQRKVLLRQFELTLPTLDSPSTKGKPLGWMSPEDWQSTQEILIKYAGLEKRLPIERYFSSE